MRNYLLTTLLTFLFFSMNCFAQFDSPNVNKVDSLGVIPAPNSIKFKEKPFVIRADTKILTDDIHYTSALYFKDLIKQHFGLELEFSGFSNGMMKKINQRNKSENAILFLEHYNEVGIGNLDADQYQVSTNEVNGIKISAHNARSSFYAVQSLMQLLPWTEVGVKETIEFPSVQIDDQPRFFWRGMLLDCSRHFMEKDFVKRYIDLLAMHKMNVLHWHITEDQGWRIQIDKYPLLTEVGAWRTENDSSIYGGFYSKEDIREIVAYAESRHITVVPEIEMPGHCQASLAAYPEYSCTGGPFEVETEWGVFKEIYCAGNDSTFQFLEDVLKEVIDMFPGKYIHIGADEVPKFRWKHCDKCQARMKTEGLKDEHELQSWFLKRINAFLKSKGKIMIGWDEIFEGGIPEGAIVQSWRSFEGAKEAIELGHQTIVSPTSHAYFDYPIRKIDLEKVYNFPVFPEGEWSEEEKKLVLGGECNMWTERAPQELVDSKVFPRLLAMSEVLWTTPKRPMRGEGTRYGNFYRRVQRHYHLLDVLGVNYGAEAVSGTMRLTESEEGLQFSVTPQRRDLVFEYQSKANFSDRGKLGELADANNEEQSTSWPGDIDCQYEGALELQAYRNGRPYGEALEAQVFPHQAYDARILLETEFSEYYTGGGKAALVDGFGGTLDFRDGFWQGYQKSNLAAEIDLEEEMDIEEVKTNFYQYNNAWIFLPTEVCYSFKDKNKALIRTQCIQNKISPKESGQFVHAFPLELELKNVQYIEVQASNLGICPDWHDAAGSEAWLFVDEIIVR